MDAGRAIQVDSRRFIRYLLSRNGGEALVMPGTTLPGWPLPPAPMRILWVNSATGGLPAMVLGVEPPEADSRAGSPRASGEGVCAQLLAGKMLVRGAMIGAVAALALGWSLGVTGGLIRARTVSFVAMVFCQLFHVFECRSETGTSSLSLFWATRGCSWPWPAPVLMSLAAVLLPAVQPYLPTIPLAPREG